MLCENVTVGENGHLYFAGLDTAFLAEKYGTPLYLMDEDRIRNRCRTYIDAVTEAFGDKGLVLYASKAASFKRIYEIMAEEGMGIDVVSSGEICTALKAGFDIQNAFFHSNNKTDADIKYAIENGIGYFVVDNAEELYAINDIAGGMGISQKVLLRITPGIDPHTFAAVSTGKVDSKFGSAIETGQAKEIVGTALSLENVHLSGFHCHIGSQVFEADVYLKAAEAMLGFIKDMKDAYGYTTEIFDIGGGFGVRYVESHGEVDIAGNIAQIASYVKAKTDELGIEMPTISFEPGRSIVADSGMTLYTAGTVKKIPGFINYVSVDGGMTDNVRFAMYGSPYTLFAANKMEEERNMLCSVVGRCCESGDIIQEKVPLPESVCRGDIIACLTTGAYNYSMASNYNRIPRPPVVMLKDGDSYVAVRRETLEDLTGLDV
ncbi:MAG: diaminopimelate decarboxylase [Ruminococcaceae bacterium]|nr:diaminopimelate decarboxylase [Oscillospiraceae bacterium]